jgi:hypothetical protein
MGRRGVYSVYHTVVGGGKETRVTSGSQSLDRSPLKLTPGRVPAFTADDMRSYLQSAPVCAGGPTLSGDPPTIETLEFVGCKELTDRLNLYIGLPDDALVCYVVLRGPFHLRRISYPPGSLHGVPVSQTVEEIYDAGTGRLLVWGAGPSKRPQ